MKKAAFLFLSVALLLGFGLLALSTERPPAPALRIQQVYGRSSEESAAISHSFVEIYNPTDRNVPLKGLSLQYAARGDNWRQLNLSGTIPAGHSFLVRCGSLNGIGNIHTLDRYDMAWDINIHDRRFKIALVAHTGLLTIPDPTPGDGVIDLLGAGDTDHAWTTLLSGISKHRSAFRIGDSGDNGADFEVLDYRALPSGRFAAVRPRGVWDGAWQPASSPMPVFSMPGGLYAQPFELTLSVNDPRAVVYYTLNGDEPTPQSARYDGPIAVRDNTDSPNALSARTDIFDDRVYRTYRAPRENVFKGTVVRARAYSEEGLPLTGIVTHSYFVEEKIADRYGLPVVSLVTEAGNLFDERNGIYVAGPRGIDAPNWDRKGSEWERPVHMELFDGDQAFSMNLGLRINGGGTRRVPQKAFRLYARTEYDPFNAAMEYDFFQGTATDIFDTPITDFRRLLLRQAGNESGATPGSTLFRDAMLQQLCKTLRVDIQAYRPAVVFLNGEFWGIYNIRERLDDEYFLSHYGIDKENIVILEHSTGATPVVNQGLQSDLDDFFEMYYFFYYNTFVGEQNYQKAERYIDLDNFIDYYVAQIYLGNIDWPGNNNKFWRHRIEYQPDVDLPYGHDGRWRWILMDLDSTTGLQYGFDYADDNITRLMRPPEPEDLGFNAEWSTLFFRRLLENDRFKERFVARFIEIMDNEFQPERFHRLIDDAAAKIRVAMPEQIALFGYLDSMEEWEENISILRNFADNRRSHMPELLQTKLEVPAEFMADDLPLENAVFDLVHDFSWFGSENELSEDGLQVTVQGGQAHLLLPLDITVDATVSEYLTMEISGLPAGAGWNWELDYYDSQGYASTISALWDFNPNGWFGDYRGAMYLRGHFDYTLEFRNTDLDIRNITFTRLRFSCNAPDGTTFVLNAAKIGPGYAR